MNMLKNIEPLYHLHLELVHPKYLGDVLYKYANSDIEDLKNNLYIFKETAKEGDLIVNQFLRSDLINRKGHDRYPPLCKHYGKDRVDTVVCAEESLIAKVKEVIDKRLEDEHGGLIYITYPDYSREYSGVSDAVRCLLRDNYRIHDYYGRSDDLCKLVISKREDV